ncbi:MAG TPA: YceI family protein [Propionicimonas sp.]|jgi:polyisoprenoid-binding protein YceI
MRKAALWAVVALVSSSAHAKEAEWHLDKAHTSIGFSVRHLGLSTVRGELKDFDATILADGATGRIVSVKAAAKAGSIDTGNEKRDSHLRSDDFFAADKFPTLSFATKSIQWNGAQFTAVVELTIRDVTKPVTFTGEVIGPRTLDFGDGKQLRVGYSAKAKINRKDFGLRFNKIAEGVAVVADEVEITIDLQASHPIG